jgi:hypothetical protein
MAKPTITTRATKGSALTWTEGDSNLTNLRDATVAIKAGSAGTSVVSDLNGEITLVAGTNITLTGDNTAKTITVDATGGGASSLDGLSDVTITGTPSVGQILRYTGNNVFENVAAGYLAAVGGDTSPQLGGNLNVNGNAIVSTSNGNIRVEPNGSGNIMLTPSTGQIILGSTNYPTTTPSSGQVLTAGTGGALSWATPSSGGIANVVEDTTPQLGGNLDVNGQQIVSVSNGNIVITPNGSGKTQISAINYNEGALYDLGTTGGTVAPNVANGNVQKITLNSALTINAFTSPVAGQSLTLIIYGGTAYTAITSTMKFAGGIKTLTGTAGCIDILSVYYDGTNYFASLGKGFA